MKIAYLMLAHNNPMHLSRLIGALSSGSSSFFVHIDRKSSLEEFSNIVGDNVHVSRERVAVYWGDFSQVEAILLLLRIALADQCRYDYFVLLSGSDYPLQPVSYIESFFERNKGKEFMNIVPIPCESAGKPLSLLTTYKSRPGDPVSKISRFVRKRLVRIGVLVMERDYKSCLRNVIPYGGSTWWALSRAACEYIESFVAEETRLVDFFKHAICPDESFFQTILGNSPYRVNIERNLTYTDWNDGRDSPAYITGKHLEIFQSASHIHTDDPYGAGEALFARKFSDQSEDLVAQIDQLIRERDGLLSNR